MVILLPFAVNSLWRGREVDRSLDALHQQIDTQNMADAPAVVERLRTPGGAPSAVLADSLYVARFATALPASPRRRSLLDLAVTRVTEILPSRRYWGEAWAILAFALASRDGERSPDVLRSFARSYLDSPYLPGLAGWRARYGLQNWDALGEGTRSAVAQEAVWYARRGSEEASGIFDLARRSPGYWQFMRSWLRARPGDVDFQRLTP
ncbi:hypothetical protein BH10PSE13_BH10PSE13_04540 [soil metagenome]